MSCSVSDIEAILPQTQCGRCDTPSCHDYAKSVLNGDDINKCYPGGKPVMQALAKLTNRAEIAIRESSPQKQLLAVINEDKCIGCTLCIQACPVDAIMGSAKQMHEVIDTECTGCELCVSPCPVNCITMVDNPDNIETHKPIVMGKYRFDSKNSRLEKDKLEKKRKHALKAEKKEINNYIQDAILRAKQKRESLAKQNGFV